MEKANVVKSANNLSIATKRINEKVSKRTIVSQLKNFGHKKVFISVQSSLWSRKIHILAFCDHLSVLAVCRELLAIRLHSHPGFVSR